MLNNLIKVYFIVKYLKAIRGLLLTYDQFCLQKYMVYKYLQNFL